MKKEAGMQGYNKEKKRIIPVPRRRRMHWLDKVYERQRAEETQSRDEKRSGKVWLLRSLSGNPTGGTRHKNGLTGNKEGRGNHREQLHTSALISKKGYAERP